ncbi:uncharacterized protein LOC111868801 [Cryptotermes secundus]|uniref:uncharacterized protein LOC111868801 n=1 Tax=Cryptotermes secundus TaxID=105785 RepID=UPI001454BD12|nr:uncharacterized protein LOC111868801 [Cryptotermes secundus]
MMRVSGVPVLLLGHLWSRIIIEQCYGLTYEDVKTAGSGVEFSPMELFTLKQEDLEQSLVYLGKDSLSLEQASSIWKALVKAYGDVSEIPDKCLQQLGWIASGIPLEDISNITVTEIDTIAALGQFHNLSLTQLTALAAQVHKSWAAKEPEDYTCYDLIALQHILCGFNRTAIERIHPSLTALAAQVHKSWAAKEPEDYTCYDLIALQHILCGFNRTAIERIHPSAYSKAAKTLGGLKYCPMEILQGLATLAIDSAAFGNTALWTPAQVNAVGCVLGGLDMSYIASIPAKSLEFLTPDAARCIPPQLIKAMSAAQKEKLQSTATTHFSREQRAALSSYMQVTHCMTNSSEIDCSSSPREFVP